MKKLLFSAYSLDVGGIETALVTLLNELAKKQYEITLVLEKKQGIFLEDIDKKIKIIEYSPSNNKNAFLRKIINLAKRTKFILKYKNKFDFSASYATYSLPGSFVARTASKNSALWVHSNYMTLFNNDKNEFNKFFEQLSIKQFSKIIFVSNDAKKAFIEQFAELGEKSIVINNIIDYNKIIKLSEENIAEKKEDNITTFLYVGRLTEKDKKVSKIIESAKILNEKNIPFKVIIIGDGKDKKQYTKMVQDYNLEGKILFLGKKKNPYPYFKISDYLILTSEYEGFPVVYNEAKILNLPVITTNVSDSETIIGNNYGIITSKDINDIAKNMDMAIKSKIQNKEKFDFKKYNEINIQKLEKIIN